MDKLRSYGWSLTGKSHIEKGLGCQDNHIIKPMDSGLIFACVADGVGSAELSHEGARLAVESLGEYVSENIEAAESWESKKAVLQTGFDVAMKAIICEAEQKGRMVSDFDTTLTAVIYDGYNAAFGHSGDGGAIGICQDGKYKILTQVQKGEAFNEVYPLRSGKDIWTFGIEKGLSGLMLVTDGILDIVAPPLLKNSEQPYYIRFISRFIPYDIFDKDEEEEKLFAVEIARFLTEDCQNIISDDMTVAALWNKENMPELQGEEYFSEPDWASLKKEKYYKLYPHLKPKEEQYEPI